jgi:DHA2 family multidrug resistance protein
MSDTSHPVTNKWLVTLAVMLATVLEVLDVTIANVALPHMQASFSATIDEVTLVLTSYLVSSGIVIPLTGWLADRLGQKRLFVGSTILFTASSVLCGLAWNLESIVLFRIAQGIGGAALMPLSQATLLRVFPEAQHGLATAVWGIGIMAAPILGPTLGGWLTDNYHWRWVFLVNLPLGLVAVALQLAFVPDDSAEERPALRVDYVGLLLVALSIGCMQIVLDRGERSDWFAAPWVWAFTAVSLLSLALLIPWELRHEAPVIDLRLFRKVSFASGTVLTALLFACLYSNLIMFGLFLQTVMQYPAWNAGLTMAPRGMATMVGMFVIGQLYTRLDPRLVLAAGLTLVAVSSFLMANFHVAYGQRELMLPLVVSGIGIGWTFVPLSATALSGVPATSLANATGLFNLMRNTGASVGIAISGTLLVRWGQIHQSMLVQHVNPLNRMAELSLQGAQTVARQGGADPFTAADQARAMVYGLIQREATVLAFEDVFRFAGIVALCILPLLLLLGKGRSDLSAVH